VPKKDISIRMCVDYRRLNQVTFTEQWPLPRIDDILDGLLGSKWFLTLDLKSGYYQVAMSPNSIAKTALTQMVIMNFYVCRLVSKKHLHI
jgi:hypothetical protein